MNRGDRGPCLNRATIVWLFSYIIMNQGDCLNRATIVWLISFYNKVGEIDGRRKREEGRGKMEEGRGKMEEGRWKKEEGKYVLKRNIH